jgi:hypothetical protein
MKWVLAHDYTHVYKCDDDSWVHIPRLLASGFEKYDYMGGSRTTNFDLAHGGGLPFGQGGAGYWLSRKAMQHVADSAEDFWKWQECEDIGVGILLGTKGIGLHVDPRYFHGTELPQKAKSGIPSSVILPRGIPTLENDQVSAHKCPRWKMEIIHKKFV